MFRDAVKTTGNEGKIVVKDLAELVCGSDGEGTPKPNEGTNPMVASLERCSHCATNDTTLETLLATPGGQAHHDLHPVRHVRRHLPLRRVHGFPAAARSSTCCGAGFIDEVFKSDSMLRCVACYACMAKCPRGIRLTDVLLPLVKEQTLVEPAGDAGASCRSRCENMPRYGNPMGESPRKRAAWAATAGMPMPRHGRVSGTGGRALVRRVLHLLLRRAARTTAGPRPSCSTRWAWISPSWATRRSAPAIAAS